MKNVSNFLYIILFVTSSICAQHKIIYLISPPRSLSVGFLRMMEARKDCVIMHEPSHWAWCYKHVYDDVQHWYKKDSATTFDQVKQTIFKHAEHTNVFIKEMSFAGRDFLINDPDFLANPQVYFVFLLRDPHSTIVSFTKKASSACRHRLFSYLMGYQAAYAIFEKVKACGAHPPLIILSEELAANPEKIVQQFCQHVGIPFKPEALHWDNLGTDFDGQEWGELKYKDAFQRWHAEAVTSTCFHPLTGYEKDAHGEPTFKEIAGDIERERCRKAYEENMIYYQLLLKEKNN